MAHKDMDEGRIERLFNRYSEQRESRDYAGVKDVYVYTLPQNAVEFASLPAMRREFKDAGQFYFMNASAHFHQEHTGLVSRRFWVDSHQIDEDSPRIYRVSWVSRYKDHWSVEHLGGFVWDKESDELVPDLDTADEAKDVLRELVAAVGDQ